mmetsp:Transcript_43955/g.94141  ORF Transcript_43955/g.94141 Transcript_43955/m.94141 type:complete len:377 (-) Transcript_43955:421-1551(-)|eukprot:CAMPEP_0206446754 /NCGR_PEP_ID=MMETSP0324_2-20121206/16330_1 /ASSEMBLY_ACC=CAM_ASM_000836 /TAXON_ID=2866 /ORGANISM="Crypthecodinium cohnii, Strain Seligo" /LENGTH=376 /DNA_ID=CAMNT_0053915297 /DNA_START=999 /DNA_END=2129 /DNA_ORIENTATION=+
MGSSSTDFTADMEESKCAIVTFGPTQSGKSTTLGKLALPSEFAPKTGTGDGESCTEHPQVIRTFLGLALDTPGVNDSRLRFTDEEAGRRVALGMATTKAEEVKFIVFESLANDSLGLRLTAEKLCQSFGGVAAPSTLVLATKADKLDDDEKEPKLERLKEAAAKLGFHGVVLWQNKRLDTEGEQNQLEVLKKALQSVPSTKIAALEDLKDRILAKAQELCEKQIPQTTTKSINVEKQIQDPYEKTQQVEVDGYEIKKETEWRTEYTLDTKATKPQKEEVDVPCGHLWGVLGYREKKVVEVQVPDVKLKSTEKPHLVDKLVPVKKRQDITYTAFRTKVVSETQQHQVTTRLPVSKFMAEARELVMQEIRGSLSSKAI